MTQEKFISMSTHGNQFASVQQIFNSFLDAYFLLQTQSAAIVTSFVSVCFFLHFAIGNLAVSSFIRHTCFENVELVYFFLLKVGLLLYHLFSFLYIYVCVCVCTCVCVCELSLYCSISVFSIGVLYKTH